MLTLDWLHYGKASIQSLDQLFFTRLPWTARDPQKDDFYEPKDTQTMEQNAEKQLEKKWPNYHTSTKSASERF